MTDTAPRADDDLPPVLLAGGGSGGHIVPGLAIAERLAEIEPRRPVRFVISDRPLDRRIVEAAGATHLVVTARPLSLRPAGAARFVRGFLRARRTVADAIRRDGAAHVVALGGFVAAPAVAAARAAGVPTLMVNLDAVPGRANRRLARWCDRVVSAVPLATHPDFAAAITGMPLRRGVLASDDPAASRTALGLDPDRPTLLVVGGSQGAGSVNRFLARFMATHPESLDGWQVVHLAGPGAADAARSEWVAMNVPARVDEFLDRMDLAWGAADLVVSRAGASSVAEVAANRVPALFLPYPHHRDEHQRRNAAPLAEAGGAEIATDHVDPDANLAEAGRVLRELLADGDRRRRMAAALATCDPGDGALAIARLITET